MTSKENIEKSGDYYHVGWVRSLADGVLFLMNDHLTYNRGGSITSKNTLRPQRK